MVWEPMCFPFWQNKEDTRCGATKEGKENNVEKRKILIEDILGGHFEIRRYKSNFFLNA